MTTSIALAVLLTLNPNQDTKTVTIEAPGITCMGRFTDSLNKHVVSKHDWINNVSITYMTSPTPTADKRLKSVSPAEALLTARRSAIKFEIAKDADPIQLARILKSCGYYDTKTWVVVSRVPFKTIQ